MSLDSGRHQVPRSLPGLRGPQQQVERRRERRLLGEPPWCEHRVQPWSKTRICRRRTHPKAFRGGQPGEGGGRRTRMVERRHRRASSQGGRVCDGAECPIGLRTKTACKGGNCEIHCILLAFEAQGSDWRSWVAGRSGSGALPSAW